MVTSERITLPGAKHLMLSVTYEDDKLVQGYEVHDNAVTVDLDSEHIIIKEAIRRRETYEWRKKYGMWIPVQ